MSTADRLPVGGRSRTVLGVGAVLLVVVAVAFTGFVGGGSAADNPGLLDFSPSDVTAEPGETVTVDVTLAAMGGYDDDGVQSFEYVVAYDTALLTVEDVEIGPWLYQENETDVLTETSIDEPDTDSVGRLTVEQSRDPPAGGVSETDDTPTATITFAVAEDASPATAVVQFESADAALLEFPLPVLTSRELLIAVNGGGDRHAPLDRDDESDEPGVTLADDSERGDADNDRSGFGGIERISLAAVGLGILMTVVVVAVASRRQN